MNHDKLVQAFTDVLNHAFTGHCEELSHSKKTYHTGDTPCPEEKALHDAARVVQEFFRDYCKQYKKTKKASKEPEQQAAQEHIKSNSEIILEKMGVGRVK